jgi:hypothetical protein
VDFSGTAYLRGSNQYKIQNCAESGYCAIILPI